ncbi:TetR/AcrR family transcriptional regulator [Tumebacillus lipolyticus]|uniref:TetR/AcrR family transcriptional regulator n=1 Tax=Tumebacillus lipolyticus TaxID=1280370 RepID=A0ABW4ZY47_9BACL
MARERKFTTDRLFQEVKHVLLEHGYEGFTFGHVAERLDISRGALYKYYENKEELITDFMIYEMDNALQDIRMIETHHGFEAQFDCLLEVIFEHSMMHQILSMAHQLKGSSNQKVLENKSRLHEFHTSLYQILQQFIDRGRQEKVLKEHLPDELLLGVIIQMINIPNHVGVQKEAWIRSVNEILRHGMFEKN